jgi:biotin synthase
MKSETLHLEDLLGLPTSELLARANSVRKESVGSNLQLCSILSARSGSCSEDCQFCAQSSHHKAEVDVYPLKPMQEIVSAAQAAVRMGAERFGIVTSGNRLSSAEVDTIACATEEIVRDLGIGVCGSLGALRKTQLLALKRAGMTRFHHNIETSRSFYRKIVSTHSYDQRLGTIRAAKAVGMEVCSGGIIGMGETWADRLEMAMTLRELDVDSVPINILTPIAGTPLESIEPITADDAIRTICLFRLVLKDKVIKIAAGRERTLGQEQVKGFQAGANGMIIGGYLTIQGDSLEKDYALIEEIKRAWTE